MLLHGQDARATFRGGMAILAMNESGQEARSRFCDGPSRHLSFTGKMPVPRRYRGNAA
jgi:hypothetical protein